MFEIEYDLSAIPDLGTSITGGSVISHTPFHQGKVLLRNEGGVLWVGSKACSLWRAPHQDAVFDERIKGETNDCGTVAWVQKLVPKNCSVGGGLAQALFDHPELVPENWWYDLQILSMPGFSSGLIFWGTECTALSGEKAYPILTALERQLQIGMILAGRVIGIKVSVIAL